jgi:hypothetical protein
MWQFVTLEANGVPPSTADVRKHLGLTTADPPRPVGVVRHALTHRRYEFDVYVCSAPAAADAAPGPIARTWVTLAQLDAYPLPRPHLKVIELLTTPGPAPNRAHRDLANPSSDLPVCLISPARPSDTRNGEHS